MPILFMEKCKEFINKRWFSITVVIILLLQFFRLFSGHGITDEHFYSALSYKMATYGSLFVGDWDIGQLFVFITIPFVKLYLALFHSTDGIVFYFRVLYLILVTCTAKLIYLRFNKEFKNTRLAILIYLLFVPFNIASLSYNTLSINLLMQSVCLYGLKQNKFFSFASGLLFGCAVLASPYLSFAYFIVCIFILSKMIKTKKVDIDFISSFIGIVIMAMAFLFTVLSGGSVKHVIANIIATLNEPSYASSMVHSLFRVAYHCYRAFGLLFIPFVLGIIYESFKPSTKLRYINYTLGAICILFAIFVRPFDLSIGGHCVVNLILTLMALPLVIRSKNKSIQCIYSLFVFHAFVISISSNVGIRSSANVLINSVVLFILLLQYDYVSDGFKSMVYGFVFVIYFYTRMFFNYIEPVNGNVQIDKGPLKYLVSDQAFVDEYNRIYEELKTINSLEVSKYLLIESDLSWIYLSLENKEVINYSLIRHIYPKEDIVNRIHEYLELNPYDQFYVYIMDNYYDVTIDDIFNDYEEISDNDLQFGKLYFIGN